MQEKGSYEGKLPIVRCLYTRSPSATHSTRQTENIFCLLWRENAIVLGTIISISTDGSSCLSCKRNAAPLVYASDSVLMTVVMSWKWSSLATNRDAGRPKLLSWSSQNFNNIAEESFRWALSSVTTFPLAHSKIGRGLQARKASFLQYLCQTTVWCHPSSRMGKLCTHK